MNGGLNSFGRGSGLVDRAAAQAGGDESLERAKRAVDAGISKVSAVPDIGGESGSYRNKLLDLLRRERDLIARLPAAGEERDARRSEQASLNREFAAFKASFEAWAPDFIESHGFTTSRDDSDNDHSDRTNR
jgi:hypothetical protein